MSTHRALFSRASLALGAILFFTAPSVAQEIVTGFEGGPSVGEGYITPIFSFPLDTVNAITVKPMASYLYYDERSRLGETKVTSPAAALGVGYRYTGTDVTLDIGPAIEVIWQRKKPLIGRSSEQTLFGVAFAADLYYQLAPLTGINLAATYDQPNRYYWTRGTLKERVVNQTSWALFLGPEVTDQGATDLQQISGGGLIEVDFDQGATALQFRGGYSWLTFSDHSKDQRSYVGAALYHRF